MNGESIKKGDAIFPRMDINKELEDLSGSSSNAGTPGSSAGASAGVTPDASAFPVTVTHSKDELTLAVSDSHGEGIRIRCHSRRGSGGRAGSPGVA